MGLGRGPGSSGCRAPVLRPKLGSAPLVAAGLVPARRWAADGPPSTAQHLDVRVGQDLDGGGVRRPHDVLPSLGLEYLDIERITDRRLDVKRFDVKMCADA